MIAPFVHDDDPAYAINHGIATLIARKAQAQAERDPAVTGAPKSHADDARLLAIEAREWAAWLTASYAPKWIHRHARLFTPAQIDIIRRSLADYAAGER